MKRNLAAFGLIVSLAFLQISFVQSVSAQPSQPLTITPSTLPPQVQPAQSQTQILNQIQAYLNSINSMQGEFVQFTSLGQRSEGIFYLLKPGRIRFDYAPPNPIEVIADGSSVAVRDNRLNTQDIYPLSQTPLKHLLSRNLNLAQATTIRAIEETTNKYVLVIEEENVVGESQQLSLIFNKQDFTLDQWTVHDAQGTDTTISIYNVETNIALSRDLFQINFERVLQ